MELNWYDFGESALLDINYSPFEAKLSLIIDARKTIDHPRGRAVQAYEHYWEEIQIVFHDVRCCDFIRNPNMKSNGEDLGSIELLTVYENQDGTNPDFWNEKSYDYIQGKMNHGVTSQLAKQYCEFMSDDLGFVVGFDWLLLKDRHT